MRDGARDVDHARGPGRPGRAAAAWRRRARDPRPAARRARGPGRGRRAAARPARARASAGRLGRVVGPPPHSSSFSVSAFRTGTKLGVKLRTALGALVALLLITAGPAAAD